MNQDNSQLDQNDFTNTTNQNEERVNKSDVFFIASIVNLFGVVPSALCTMLLFSLFGVIVQSELMYRGLLILAIVYGVASVVFFVVTLILSIKNSKKENNSPMIVKAIIICAFLIVMTLIVIEIVRLFRVI